MTADKKTKSTLSRREFLQAGGVAGLGLVLGPLLTACTVELEKPLIVNTPLSITFNNQPFLFNEIPETTQASLQKLLTALPSIIQTGPVTMVMPTEPPFNWPENEIRPPQGELLPIVNIAANGFCHFQVPNGFGHSHFVITDNNHHLYVPVDEANYQSYANLSKARVNFDQLAVIQQLTRSLDWNNLPPDQQEYSLLYATETRFFKTNNRQERQVLHSPGCRAFLEEAVSQKDIRTVDPEKYSNVPLHDLEIATQVLTTLLLASERFSLIGSSGVPKQIPLFSPHQPQEAMSQVKLENVDTLGLEARDQNLERDITDIETTFKATCSTLPKELPLAFKIWEQRTNDKGKIESRIRLLFMKSDGTTSENWFFAPERKELNIGSNILLEELPNEVRVALKLNEEGYQPIGIEQAPTRLFWDGEAYRIGVYNRSETNQVVFEWDDVFAINGLAKTVVGAQTGSIDHENFEKQSLDLTQWYYLLRNQGIDDVGPAGLTLPEWVTKILWGMEPGDDKLTSVLSENDYFLPLFSDTPLTELDEQKSALLVYLGARTNLAMTLQRYWNWQQFSLNSRIASFDGEVKFADFLPLWKKDQFSRFPNLGDLKTLNVGGNLLGGLAVPYMPDQFSVIRGKMLSKIKQLFQNLTFLYQSQPEVSGGQIGKVPIFDQAQKKQRRQALAKIVKSTPEL